MVLPPIGYKHSDTWFYLMRDFRTFAVWSFWASVLSNFLPASRRFARWPRLRWSYEFLIDLIALVGCHWSVCLPSLQLEWFALVRGLRIRKQRWRARRVKR